MAKGTQRGRGDNDGRAKNVIELVGQSCWPEIAGQARHHDGDPVRHVRSGPAGFGILNSVQPELSRRFLSFDILSTSVLTLNQ